MGEYIFPVISAVISGAITYITVKAKAKNEIEKIKSQAQFDHERAEQEYKHKMEMMIQQQSLELQVYKEKSTNDAVTGLMKGEFSINGLSQQVETLTKTLDAVNKLKGKLPQNYTFPKQRK